MVTIKEVHYHRNGVCGEGFHTGILHDSDNGEMLFVRFNDKGGGIRCAVFTFSGLDERNLKFGENSWRGDDYAKAVDKAIAEFNARP